MDMHALGTVAVAALVTMALRFLPFIIFRGDRERRLTSLILAKYYRLLSWVCWWCSA